MRIFFVGNINIPTLGQIGSRASNARVEKLAAALSAEGHAVAVGCASFRYQRTMSRYRGVQLLHVPSLISEQPGGKWHLILSLFAARFWRSDVIHIQGWQHAGWLWFAKVLRPRVRIVITVDDLAGRPSFFQRLYYRWLGWQVRLFTYAVTTPTRTDQYRLLTDYAISANYIPDGYEETLGNLAGRRHSAAPRGRYGVVLFRQANEVRWIIQAMRRFRPSVPLLLVPLRTEPALTRAYASRKVRWLPIQGPRSLATLLQKAAFTIVAGEAVPANILLLTMAAGSAVIAETRPEYEELLGVAGQYVQPRDAQNLRQILSATIKDRHLRERWGKLAQRRARAHFRWSRLMPEYSALYHHAEARIVLLDSAQRIRFTRPVLS